MKRVDKLTLGRYLSQQIPTFFRKSNKSTDLYEMICSSLIQLANSYNVTGIRNSKINNYVPNKNGKVDVIWINSKGTVKLAIEVDGGLRKKSIQKLQKIKADQKFWVYYGNPIKVEEFIKKYDPHGTVKIINLSNIREPIRKRKNAIKFIV